MANVSIQNMEDMSFWELLQGLWQLTTQPLRDSPPLLSLYAWEWGVTFFFIFFCLACLVLAKISHFRVFQAAFERIPFKKRDIDRSLAESITLEITIPKTTQATAFQVQQKIFKTLHSVYDDPISGQHNFHIITLFYLFQKLYRFLRVYFSSKVFFSFQILGQHPHISFRLAISKRYLDRIEKALYSAYPGAEISIADTDALMRDIVRYPNSFLSFGQTMIEGEFYHRIRTFKDVSSDPVDSVISAMEGLGQGQFMAYTITLSPSSHFFNQIIHYRLDEEERTRQGVFNLRRTVVQTDAESPDLLSQLRTAKIEKMKSSLFQITISYWAVMPTAEESKAKLANIQSVLAQINQKNMNMVKHRVLFTKQIAQLERMNHLHGILEMRPILDCTKFGIFTWYHNPGQIVSDGELYSLWHMPNLADGSGISVRTAAYKKLPSSHAMRSFKQGLFVDLGSSNFSMHESEAIGIPTWEDMKKHVSILGGTGSGKSETLKTILDNLLRKKGAEKTALLIIDPKNDFATDLLTMIPEHRKDDVIYFNPSRQKERPLSFPFFSKFSGEKTNDERIEFLVSVMKRFVQIDSASSWGPELENILRQLFATAYLLPKQSLSGLDMLLHDESQIKNIRPFLPPRLAAFWTDSILKRSNNDLARYLATTNNKIGKFLDYAELANITDRTDAKITFEEMIASGKIFIANLGSSSEHMKKYYSVYLAAHIAEAIFGQARIPSENRKPCVFVVDEFQRVSSDIFETLFSETRAFNTAIVISNQFMGQLEERIKKSIESNIATKIFMRTQSVDDAEIAEKILGEAITMPDVINLPTGGGYIKTLVNGIPQKALSIKIRKTDHPTENIQAVEGAFIQTTMDRYGTPLAEIEKQRDETNALYYTSDKKEEFLEEMKEHLANHSSYVYSQD